MPNKLEFYRGLCDAVASQSLYYQHEVASQPYLA